MTIPVRALAALVVGTTLSVLQSPAEAQQARRSPAAMPEVAGSGAAQTTPDDGVAVRALGALTNRSLEGLTFEHRSDGTIGLDLQGRFQNVMLATTRPDGTLDVSCVADGHDQTAPAAMPLWTPGRDAAVRRLGAPRSLPAPIVVPAPKTASLEEK